MTVQMPRRRDQRLGKNISKIPNRTDVQRIGPASDPGGKGGPTNVPLGAFGGGEGLEVFGKGVTDIGITEVENIRKTELKMRDDAEKNALAKYALEAKRDYKKLAEFRWDKESTHEDGVDEEFSTAWQDLGQKYEEKGAGFSTNNKEAYKNKLLEIQITNSVVASKNKFEIRDNETLKRVKDNVSEWYISQTSPDLKTGFSRIPDPSLPENQEALREKVKEFAGELSVEKQETFYNNFLLFMFENRVKFLSSETYHSAGGSYKDPRQAIALLAQRMAPHLPTESLETVFNAIRDIDKTVRASSSEMKKAEQERIDRKEMTTELTALYELYTHPDNKDQKKMSFNNYLRRRQDIYTAYGKSIAPMEASETYKPGDIVKDPQGKISKTEGAPTNVTEGSILVPGTKATGDFRDPSAESPDTGAIPSSDNETSTKSNFPPGTIENPKPRDPPKLTSRKPDEELGYLETHNPITGELHPVAKYVTVSEAEEKVGVEFKPTEESVRAFSLAAMGIRGSAKNAMAIMKKDQLTFFKLITNNIANELEKGTYSNTPEAYYAEFAKIETANPELIPTTYDFEDAFDALMKEEKIFSTAAPGPDDVKNLIIELDTSAKKINLDDATGVFSGLTKGFGNLFGSFFESAVSPEVVVGRLQLGLVVRDFIRLFMLSKRFAVKEQEFLRDIYPGSGALNSPPAARALMIDLDRELDTALNAYKKELKMDVISVEEKQKIWQDVTRIVSMKKRIARFDLKGIGLYDKPESAADIQQLAQDDPEVFKAMFKEDAILDNSLNTLEESKLLPSGMEKDPKKPQTESLDKISQNASDLSLVDLETMPLEEAGQTLAKMPVEEIFKRWEGTPPEIRDKWALKLDHLIADALNRPPDIDYTGVESKPKKAKKKKGKK